MARLIALGLFAIVVVIVSTSRPEVAAAPSCSVVNKKLLVCVSYIKGSTTKPNGACCNGVNEMSALAKSKADLAGICNCIKAELPKIGKVNPALFVGLPKICGVNRNFPPVSPNYDCTKILMRLHGVMIEAVC